MIFEEDKNENTRTREKNYADRGRSRNQPTTLGKLPPQAPDIEEAILGALMLERDAFPQVSDILKPEVFYRDNHQRIYYAMQQMYNEKSPIDILTVTQRLRKNGELEMVGGAYLITELTNRVASAANIEYHARIVYQKFLQREIIRISTQCINEAYEDTTDVLELLDKNQKEMFQLYSFSQSHRTIENIGDLAGQAVRLMEQKKENGITGIPTGFESLDKFCSGWQPTDLTIIAARPAMGKTAFVLSCAKNASFDFDKPTVFFSLEMSSIQLTNRMISSESDVKHDHIIRKNIYEDEWAKIHHSLTRFERAPLFIDDTPGLTLTEFRSKAHRLKRDHDIQLIIIDYLQLMRAEEKFKGNREQEIGTITRGLKQVAKELNVPVIALSQLSRALETRPGTQKRPMLSDLRESGSIEQDADNVLFLFRPEYYGLEVDENNNSTVQMAEIIWAKHRAGAQGTRKLRFQGNKMRFSEWTDEAQANVQQVMNVANAMPEVPNNFILKPSRMDDFEDEPPF